MPKKLPQYVWRVFLLRATGRSPGEVEATDEKSGIEKAVEEFLLSSEQTKRLIVQRMSMRGTI
jgi:hypothetical protein